MMSPSILNGIIGSDRILSRAIISVLVLQWVTVATEDPRVAYI